MNREDIERELKELDHNIGVLERMVIGMNNYKEVLAGYRKVLRDQAAIMRGMFELKEK